MSSISKKVKENSMLTTGSEIENFMGGTNYVLSPLMKLKMVAASSIFGEPQYYNDGLDKKATVHEIVYPYFLFPETVGKKSSDIMTEAIDAALTFDFKGTLDLAVELRNKYLMRLNPQIIMVRAAIHKNRVKFNQEFPGYFRQCEAEVMSRCDEPSAQFAYYMYLFKNKKGIPSVLKRAWADRYEKASRYELSKYKNAELGIIDTVRICHASSDDIDELMSTGSLSVEQEEKTWEQLRCARNSWKTIFLDKKVYIPHMALLRNLCNIFEELHESKKTDRDLAEAILKQLLDGVKGGKQFPFRYYNAYKIVSLTSIPFKEHVIKTLENCLIKARENMPILKGKTMILTDNSGSAHGAFNFGGRTTIAEINNLSAILTAQQSEDGVIGVFGDKLQCFAVSKEVSPFVYMEKINKIARSIGQGTECGIWLFFKEALKQKENYDNIFIYSDMQAGHGGLYVTDNETNELQQGGYAKNQRYVNVLKLVETYRETVNPKVNLFTVQTAGYTDNVLPEAAYRTGILTGWTGKEIVYAKTVSDLWDEVENS